MADNHLPPRGAYHYSTNSHSQIGDPRPNTPSPTLGGPPTHSPAMRPPSPPPQLNYTDFGPPVNLQATRFTGPVIEIPPRSYPSYQGRCPLPTINTEAAAVTRALENAEAFTRASRLLVAQQSPISLNRPQIVRPALAPITAAPVPEGSDHRRYLASAEQVMPLNLRPTPTAPRTFIEAGLKPTKLGENYYWDEEKKKWCISQLIEGSGDGLESTEKSPKRERLKSGMRSMVNKLKGKCKEEDDGEARRDALKARISDPLGLRGKRRHDGSGAV